MNIRVSAQNLSEGRTEAHSIFWHGRAWFRKKASYDELLHVEWAFGKHAESFAITASFGYGDSGRDTCLHVCIPWIFSIFLVLPIGPRCRECKTGIQIHNGAFWFHPLSDSMESRREWPWWKKCHSWAFPWTFDWYKTEILDDAFKPVWTETHENRLGNLDHWDERETTAAKVTKVWPYEYVLKNGDVQQRTAAIYIERMTWRARWWPIIPRTKVSTSIHVNFNGEVGEKSGSWKGGCTGCGYEMLPEESAFLTLCRMERERKFN